MIEKGISRLGRPLQDISTAIENVGKLEISKLERGFPTLATITGAEPMLGFLGTVIGMVQSFYAMAQAGNNIEVSLTFGWYLHCTYYNCCRTYCRYPRVFCL